MPIIVLYIPPGAEIGWVSQISGYHGASPRHRPSTSPFFASARRPVHSSSPTCSTQSPSPSQFCRSSFGRRSAYALAGLVSDEGSGELSAGVMGERGRSGAGDGRRRREEIMLLKEGGGDKLPRWTVGDVRVGESSCLGGYVCEESVERRRSCTCPCVCASMSRFAGVAIASPTLLASSSLSPSSSEERNSGSRSEESDWLNGSATSVLPLALTIESMSQNWTTFMNIGKRPIVLWTQNGIQLATDDARMNTYKTTWAVSPLPNQLSNHAPMSNNLRHEARRSTTKSFMEVRETT